MRRFRFFTVLAALAVLSFAASNALASSAFHGLVVGVDNQFQDDDWETIHPNFTDGDTILAVGEVLVGMFEIDSRQTPSSFDFIAHGATFTGIFMIQVETKSVIGGGTVADFTFGPAPAGAWTSLGLPAPASTDTMIIIYNDTTADGSAGNNHDDFVDPTVGTLAGALATALGAPVAEFGRPGGAGNWIATTIDNVAPFAADDFTEFIGGLSTFSANLLLTFNYITLPWLEVHAVAGNQQLAITDGVLFRSGSDPQGRLDGVTVFSIASTANAWVHPAPEPGSLAVFAGLGLAAAGARWRRRRRAA